MWELSDKEGRNVAHRDGWPVSEPVTSVASRAINGVEIAGWPH